MEDDNQRFIQMSIHNNLPENKYIFATVLK